MGSKFLVPAIIATGAGVGLDMIGNTLANAYPNTSHWIWVALFWFSIILFSGFPLWLTWWAVRATLALVGLELRSPLASIEARTVVVTSHAKAEKPLVSSKFYSRIDKEKLSDLYGELSQLFLANGASGTGSGVYGAAATLGNDWNRQVETNPGKLDTEKLAAEAQALQFAMRDFYGAIYGENAIPKKAQYLPYGDELRAVLQDDKGTRPIEVLSVSAASFNVALEAIEKAKGDVQMIEVTVRLALPRIADFHNSTSAFQGWEFEANKRAQAARKALTE
jgi:hypothetical protein